MPAHPLTARVRSSLLARVLVMGMALAAPAHGEGVLPNEATKAMQKAADQKFAEGNKLFKAGKFEEAIVAFQQAHDIVSSPDSTLMIARAQQNQGDLLKAHEAYNTALTEAEAATQVDEKYRPTLQSIQKELEDLDGVLAHLTIKLVHAPEGTSVTIDGEPVDAAKLREPILLPPGLVSVVATDPDGKESSRQVQLNAGASVTVELPFLRKGGSEPLATEDDSESEPKEKAASGGGSKTLAFVAGGIGLAGLATFGVFGAMSNSKFNDLEAACAGDHCAPSRSGDIDDGKSFQTIANVGLAVGIVGIGTSAALFLFGGSSAPAKKEPETSAQIGVGLGSIELRGRFQ